MRHALCQRSFQVFDSWRLGRLGVNSFLGFRGERVLWAQTLLLISPKQAISFNLPCPDPVTSPPQDPCPRLTQHVSLLFVLPDLIFLPHTVPVSLSHHPYFFSGWSLFNLFLQPRPIPFPSHLFFFSPCPLFPKQGPPFHHLQVPVPIPGLLIQLQCPFPWLLVPIVAL